MQEKLQTWSLTILFERCSTKFSIWLKSLNLEMRINYHEERNEVDQFIHLAFLSLLEKSLTMQGTIFVWNSW